MEKEINHTHAKYVNDGNKLLNLKVLNQSMRTANTDEPRDWKFISNVRKKTMSLSASF